MRKMSMQEWIDKKGRGNVFRISLLIFTLLLAAEAVLMRLAYTSVGFEGSRLTLRETGERVIMSDDAGNLLEFAPLSEPDPMPGYPNGSYSISYAGREMSVSLSYAEGTDYTFSDGTRHNEPVIQVYANGIDPYAGYGLSEAHKAEMVLINELISYYADYRGAGIYVGIALLCCVFLLMAHLSFFYSEALWKLRHFMTVEGGEPTDFYLVMSRFSGGALVVIIFAAYMIIISR